MVHQVTSSANVVDLYQYPKEKLPHNVHQNELTIGDLHANFMFFLSILVHHQIVDIPKKDYETLAKLYDKDTKTLTKKDITTFNKLVNSISCLNQNILIRLIGDEICDRGQNDYFIFKLLERLDTLKIQTTILLSNHGIEFLLPFEEKKRLCAPNINIGGQANSLNNLQKLIDKKLLDKEQIEEIVNQTYLKKLKLIDYSIHDNSITIYSHAGIGLNTIKSLCKKFKLSYDDSSLNALKNTLDQINLIIKEVYIQKSQVSKLTTNLKESDRSSDPFIQCIWNRNYGILQRPKSMKSRGDSYQLYFVHGHDSSERTRENIFNLDGQLGKLYTNHQVMVALKSQSTPFLSPSFNDPNNIQNLDDNKKNNNNASQTELNEAALSQYQLIINKLQKKADELKNRGHLTAYETAKKLANDIQRDFESFKIHQNAELFCKQVCHSDTGYIANARPELEKHRGWGEFLINIALGLAGLIPLLLKGTVSVMCGGTFFYARKTASAKLLDEFIIQPQNFTSVKACSS